MDRKKVESLLYEALDLNKDLFLVDLSISETNHISVIIDGDKGVNVKECIRVSRSIENNLDREEEDYSIEVSSFDISRSLTLPRQFAKNIGRKLKVVTTTDEKFEGTLEEFTSNAELVLKWKERVPKTIGKGKMTVEKEQLIKLEEVKQAKVVIIF